MCIKNIYMHIFLLLRARDQLAMCLFTFSSKMHGAPTEIAKLAWKKERKRKNGKRTEAIDKLVM